MARPKLAEMPDWPRMMSADIAAAYCSMSAERFRALCPIGAVHLGSQPRWDRKKLDAWLTRLGEIGGEAVPATEDDWVARL